MMEGVSSIRLAGVEVKMKAKVEKLEGWSAHADRDELIKFAEAALAGKRTKTIFTALGEPSAERFLAQRIHDYLGGNAVVPELRETWEIRKESIAKIS
jgi:metallo-beta-lactamase family protein